MMKVYRLSLEVVRQLGGVARRLDGRDKDPSRQLRRAAASISLNIAEGEWARGQRKQTSFSIALGSARECRACVDVAEALDYLDATELTSLLDPLDHTIAILFTLAR